MTKCEMFDQFDADVTVFPNSLLRLSKTGFNFLSSFSGEPQYVDSLIPLFEVLK